MKLYKYLSIAVALALLCGTAYMQAHLKKDPQVYLMGFAFLTLLFAFTKLWETATLLFAVLLGVIFYINYFILFAYFSRDHLGISSMIFGIVLAAVSLFLYFKYYPRQRQWEKLFSLIFLVLSVIIFLIYET